MTLLHRPCLLALFHPQQICCLFFVTNVVAHLTKARSNLRTVILAIIATVAVLVLSRVSCFVLFHWTLCPHFSHCFIIGHQARITCCMSFAPLCHPSLSLCFSSLSLCFNGCRAHVSSVSFALFVGCAFLNLIVGFIGLLQTFHTVSLRMHIFQNCFIACNHIAPILIGVLLH